MDGNLASGTKLPGFESKSHLLCEFQQFSYLCHSCFLICRLVMVIACTIGLLCKLGNLYHVRSLDKCLAYISFINSVIILISHFCMHVFVGCGELFSCSPGRPETHYVAETSLKHVVIL